MLHERNNFVNRTFKYLFEKSFRRGRAARAANRVPEFRRRILNGGIVEYARCRTSHTVALEDETYCYCTLESAMPFAEYLPYAKREQERAKTARSRKARRPGRHRAAFFLRFIYILALFFCGALHYNIKSFQYNLYWKLSYLKL